MIERNDIGPKDTIYIYIKKKKKKEKEGERKSQSPLKWILLFMLVHASLTNLLFQVISKKEKSNKSS